MSENKKYYWLKLKNDFFSDLRIKKLRRVAGGDTYTIIYLKMQLASLKSNGVIIYEGIENTFEEELALVLDEDLDNVKMTVSYLLSVGLLESGDNINYVLPETQKSIISETPDAERMRITRNKAKMLQSPNNSEQCSNTNEKRSIDIDIEIDKDIDKELDIELEKEKKVKEKRAKYGTYAHVLLSDSEVTNLELEYGIDETQEAIQYLDDYIEMTGKKYKNHNLALRKWVFKAIQEKKTKPVQENQNDKLVKEWLES